MFTKSLTGAKKLRLNLQSYEFSKYLCENHFLLFWVYFYLQPCHWYGRPILKNTRFLVHPMGLKYRSRLTCTHRCSKRFRFPICHFCVFEVFFHINFSNVRQISRIYDRRHRLENSPRPFYWHVTFSRCRFLQIDMFQKSALFSISLPPWAGYQIQFFRI